MGEPAIRATNLRYAYGEVVAVDGIDLTVAPGEIFGLLGPNGAGKTTTIRMITTLLPVTRGSVWVFGLDVAGRTMAVRRLVGYVPQQLSADAALTGRENVLLYARLFDVPRGERRTRAAEVIEAMGLTDAADRPVGTYSGGMVRRLELAQALVSSPRLLILDEPTIGLDPVARAGVWERIGDVRARTGMSVLVTTHYMTEAEEQCDRVALMHRGRIRVQGTPADLVASLGDAGDSLDDVFRAYTADDPDHPDGDLDSDPAGDLGGDLGKGGFRDVRATRRTAHRLG
jgi:ABC-2 type transport system ATP-binding protein